MEKFAASKSQKKILRKMSKFLHDGEKPEMETDEPDPSNVECQSNRLHPSKPENRDPELANAPSASASSSSPKKSMPRPGQGPDPSRPPPKKAKLMRLERRAAKKAAGGDNLLSGKSPRQPPAPCAAGDSASELENLVLSHDAECRHRLELRLVRSHPPSKEFSETLQESFEVYKKYQMAVHGDEEEEITMERYERFLVHSPLIVSGIWDLKKLLFRVFRYFRDNFYSSISRFTSCIFLL